MSTYANHHKPLSLGRNFSWTFGGNVIYAASQWGMLIVIARLGTPELVGKFSLALALTAPIMLLSNLQLRGIQTSDAERRFAFRDYLSLRFITTILALLISIGVASLGIYVDSRSLIIAVALAKSCESISDVFYGLLQQNERMDIIAQSLILRGLLSLATLTAIMYLTSSLLWGVIAMTISWAVILLLFDIPRSTGITYQLNQIQRDAPRTSSPSKRLTSLVVLALPLGITMLLVSLNTSIPRYFIEHDLDTYTLGIFSALSYVLIAGRTIITALGHSASPRLAKFYAARDKHAFRSLASKLIGVGALLGICGIAASIIAGKLLLSMIYGPEYGAYNHVFVLLMTASGIIYIASFMGYIMTAAQYFSIQAPLFTGVVLISGLACWLLVPTYGMTGAALAAIISAVVQLILTALVCYQVDASLRRTQRPPEGTIS